ncbi:late embryogenesis abundant protein Lea5-like [Phalaenopsis equestris]|uniref:late embryogenesis abundant protein Lea5-like n=1 Tax=Phalaenopsis equestris TaxID=78828 RepID=UPI0009E5A812|nr:late embryogenesis abundant protein Lea5-like [Phalaenopsis equestris]
MARAISNGKILFAALSDGLVLSSRQFSSSAAGAAASSGRGLMEEKAVLMSGIKKSVAASSDAAWVPDPVTGYYRPANRLREIDPAELRQMFLKSKE